MTSHNPKMEVLSGPERRRRWSTAAMPQWQTLPEGTQQALTALIVRLLVDNANGGSASQSKEAGHDA